MCLISISFSLNFALILKFMSVTAAFENNLIALKVENWIDKSLSFLWFTYIYIDRQLLNEPSVNVKPKLFTSRMADSWELVMGASLSGAHKGTSFSGAPRVSALVYTPTPQTLYRQDRLIGREPT